MKYKTDWTNLNDIKREWHVVDLDGQILGRSAVKIAALLTGKAKVNKVPNLDCGDYVIIVNSAGVKVTRGKETKKMYYSHSGFPGGFKEMRFDKMLEKDPNKIIELAVRNMLPNNKLRDTMLARLFVYKDTNHKHEAQQPKEYKL